MSTEYIRYPSGVTSGNAVTSLNGLTGALTLLAGAGITITPAGNTLTIAASGGTFLRLDGTNGPMTGLYSLFGDAITSLQPVTLQQLQSAQFGTVPKGSVFAATTAADGNHALTGAITADGQVVPNGQNVLLQFQTNPIENGIWVVNTGGAWARPANFANGSNGFGAYVSVVNGPTYGSTFRIQVADPCIVGTDAESWQFQAQSVYTADAVTLQLIGNQFSIMNGGVSDAQLDPAINVITTGVGSFANLSITGTAGNGWIDLIGQTVAPAQPAIGHNILYSTSTGKFGVRSGQAGAAGIGLLDMTQLGALRNYEFPNLSGIVAIVPSITAPVPGVGYVTSDGGQLYAQATLPTSAFTGILPIANGGTNNSAFTPGSVIFMGATALSEDNPNLFYDDTNNRLGIRSAATPRSALTIGAFPAFGTLYPTFDEAGFGLTSSSVATPTQMIIENTVGSGVAAGASIMLATRRGVVTPSGDRLGSLQFMGTAAVGALMRSGARIECMAAALWTATSAASNLDFYTTAINTLVPIIHARMFGGGNMSVGNNTLVPSAFGTFNVYPITTASIGLVVRPIAGQVADLAQFQSNVGVTLASVTAAGVMNSIAHNITGTAGVGFIDLVPQSSQPAANVSAVGSRVFCNVNNRFGWVDNTTGFSATFLTSGFTANRIYVLPDTNSTLANVPAAGLVVSNGNNLLTGQASLTTDVNGILPFANGGTGVAAIAAGFVTSNGAVLSSTPTINAATQLTGILPVANGGTGTSVAAGVGNIVFAGAAGVHTSNNNLNFVTGTNILTLTGTMLSRHFGGTGATPAIVRGAGSGATSTVTVTGTDAAGTITVATLGGPAINAIIFTLTFNLAYTTVPRVVFYPKNRATANLGTTSAIFNTSTTTTITATSGTVALTNATTYIWDYIVVQ